MTRHLLEGDALAAFNVAAGNHGNETNDNFMRCIVDVTTHIFPARALHSMTRRLLEGDALEHCPQTKQIRKICVFSRKSLSTDPKSQICG